MITSKNILTIKIENNKIIPVVISETTEIIRQELEDGIEYPLIEIDGVDTEISDQIVNTAITSGLFNAKTVQEYKNILIASSKTNLPILIQKIIDSVDSYVETNGSLFPIPFDVIE